MLGATAVAGIAAATHAAAVAQINELSTPADPPASWGRSSKVHAGGRGGGSGGLTSFISTEIDSPARACTLDMCDIGATHFRISRGLDSTQQLTSAAHQRGKQRLTEMRRKRVGKEITTFWDAGLAVDEHSFELQHSVFCDLLPYECHEGPMWRFRDASRNHELPPT